MTRTQTKMTKSPSKAKNKKLRTPKKAKKNQKTSPTTVQKWLFDNMDLKSAVNTWSELSSEKDEAATRKAEQRLTEVRQLLQQLQTKITDLSR